MPRSDAINILVISFLIGIFLQLILLVTGFANRFPGTLVFSLPLFSPVLAILGMFVAYFIGRKSAIFWQFCRFVLVGVLNTSIDFGILNLLVAATGITGGPSIIPLNALAFSAAVTNSYFWNRRWVFASRHGGNFVLFLIITIIGIGINSAVVFLITTFVSPLAGLDRTLWVNVAKVLATGVSLVWDFTGYRLIVFKR